jgi:hypothetical protein
MVRKYSIPKRLRYFYNNTALREFFDMNYFWHPQQFLREMLDFVFVSIYTICP